MFIQVIQGKVADEAGLQRQMDRWNEELMPGAVERGYLGSTSGTTCSRAGRDSRRRSSACIDSFIAIPRSR